MGGLLRFLLGGALGAALGYFISWWRARRVPRRPEPWLREAPPEPVAPHTTMFETPRQPEVEVRPVVEPEPQPKPAPQVELVSVPPAGSEPGLVPAVEPPAAIDTAAEAVPAPAAERQSVISAEELRARIEESRRRIRQELEQPFDVQLTQPPMTVTAEDMTAESPVTGSGVSEAAIGDQETTDIPTLAVDEGRAPSWEVQSADDSFFEELGVRVDRPASSDAVAGPAETTVVSEADAPTLGLRDRLGSALLASEEGPRPTPTELEASLSYDAMRARIEATRNRLKAKAGEAQAGMDLDGPAVADTSQDTRSDRAETPGDIEARIDSLLGEE